MYDYIKNMFDINYVYYEYITRNNNNNVNKIII